MYLTREQVFWLLKTYGSPLYVYDKSTIIKRCQQLNSFAKRLSYATDRAVHMHYSTKANSNLEILKLIKDCGIWADCMSPKELNLDLEAGFTPKELLYVCNNISKKEMEYVKSKDILICLDSVSQVRSWANKFPKTKIMVRINPGTIGVGHSDKVITSGPDTKFGISEANLPELLQVADIYNLEIVGAHQHLGSLFLNDKIDQYVTGVSAFLEIIKRSFKELSIIDLGGGFGVPYAPGEEPLNFDILYRKLVPVLKNFVEEYPSVKEFKFEPGRFIPCEAGLLLGTVTSIKEEYGTKWIGTDIGMGTLVRPSMYGSYHEIEVIEKNPCGIMVFANICGNVCESGDVLGKNRTVNWPKVDDAVVIRNAGAYGYSMSSNYTGRNRPAEAMLTENDCYCLIRPTQSLYDF